MKGLTEKEESSSTPTGQEKVEPLQHPPTPYNNTEKGIPPVHAVKRHGAGTFVKINKRVMAHMNTELLNEKDDLYEKYN